MDIIELPGFITARECDKILSLLPKTLQKETTVVIDEALLKKVSEVIGDKTRYAFTNHITIGYTTKAIIRHTDPKLDDRVTHRMYIYLQVPSIGGGTFIEGQYVAPAKGKAVIFDINLEHRGEKFPRGETKKIIGFRLFKEA